MKGVAAWDETQLWIEQKQARVGKRVDTLVTDEDLESIDEDWCELGDLINVF